MQPRLVQINVSKGGVPKTPIAQAAVGVLGIDGDEHRHPEFHGGPQQALLLIASEVIDTLREEGWPLFYGALGENLTTAGLDHRSWRAGLRYRIEDLVLELTMPRQPCVTLNRYGKGIQQRIYDARVQAMDPDSAHWGESGFYAAVLTPGNIRKDATIEEVHRTF